MKDKISFHNHKVGDGFHYVTDNFRMFPNGSYQFGDTSEGCVLFNLELITAAFGLPGVNDLWNCVYPEDLMSLEDLSYIISTSVAFTERFDVRDPDNLKLAVADLTKIGCHDLAEQVMGLLLDRGVL